MNEQAKNDWDTEYYFFDHDAKRQHILQRMFEAEQLHFEMMWQMRTTEDPTYLCHITTNIKI